MLTPNLYQRHGHPVLNDEQTKQLENKLPLIKDRGQTDRFKILANANPNP